MKVEEARDLRRSLRMAIDDAAGDADELYRQMTGAAGAVMAGMYSRGWWRAAEKAYAARQTEMFA